VISNQCTGGPAYQGDQDADPTNNSDCPTDSEEDDVVRAAELEVFSR
jgi:extracellular elastinolytic metalloproteinase